MWINNAYAAMTEFVYTADKCQKGGDTVNGVQDAPFVTSMFMAA